MQFSKKWLNEFVDKDLNEIKRILIEYEKELS